MNSLIWGTCNTPLSTSQCQSNMASFASQLQSDCSQELSNTNLMVVNTLTGKCHIKKYSLSLNYNSLGKKKLTFVCSFSSTSISGHAWLRLSSRSHNQCILLPKRCSKLESIGSLLLFYTAGHPPTKHSHAHLFAVLEEHHGDVRRCSPGPNPRETVDSAEKCV